MVSTTNFVLSLKMCRDPHGSYSPEVKKNKVNAISSYYFVFIHTCLRGPRRNFLYSSGNHHNRILF